MKTIKKLFPESTIGLVSAGGTDLAPRAQGVTVTIATRDGEEAPCSAEVEGGEHYAEIGLWFEGKELSDFDGVFALPREVGEVLTEMGFSVPEECF